MLADTQHTHKDAKDGIHDSCASFLQLWYLEPALAEYGHIFCSFHFNYVSLILLQKWQRDGTNLSETFSTKEKYLFIT